MFYKTPLSVYIIWHPENKDAENIANELYSLLCRDISKPLIRTTGIPVYFRNTKPIKEINFNESINTAIIPLIDDAFVLDKGLSEFVDLLYNDCLKDNVFRRIYPVALSASAYNVSANLGKLNFTKGYDKNITKQTEVFSFIKTPILHELCRFLMQLEADQKVPPVKLFVSHSKHDNKVNDAIGFRDYVNSNTQLKTFFDANDIPNGSTFSEEIKAAIKESALVVFQSDTYADREWCRIEVLEAKKHNCPITIVNAVQAGEQRVFPYLGNFPSIRFDNDKDFSKIIDLTLLQVLKKLYLSKLFKDLTDLYNIKAENILTTSPELFHFIKLKQIHSNAGKEYSLFIYPDPPLGSEELELLNQMENKFVFVTPLTLPSMT